MTIKPNKSTIIYTGCLLCQSIEDLERFLAQHSSYKNVLNENEFKRVIIMKEKWKESLSESKGEA